MTRPSSPAQRTRRLLNQASVQRSHRRSDLIRLMPEEEHTDESVKPVSPTSLEIESTVDHRPT